MNRLSFDAVIFDLDGVITKTANVHSQAWKQMFDEFLNKFGREDTKGFEPFSHSRDYLKYIDGKPRYQGVKSFLESRKITLPYGKPSDPPDTVTICGLGNRKNQIFNVLISSGKIEVYYSTIGLIKDLKRRNIRIGVASSSKNCKQILQAAKLSDMFEARVDGILSEHLDLKGKPEPDIFQAACRSLNVYYDRSVIIEDAVSGVQAGRNGGFGMVIGIARDRNFHELRKNGADIVVSDLGEVTVDTIEEWFDKSLKEDSWFLRNFGYTQGEESRWESLFTVGNGYLGTRGAMEEVKSNSISYPGTYIAGVYNRLKSTVAGRTVVNEDMVNCPNWLLVSFRIADAPWFSFDKYELTELGREINLKTGVLSKRMRVKDEFGRETKIISHRFASMENCHALGLKYELRPQNYASTIQIKVSLDGTIVNDGVKRYRQLNSKHLTPMDQGREGEIWYILVKTNQSKILIAEAMKLRIFENGREIFPEFKTLVTQEGEITVLFVVDAKKGDQIRVEKTVAVYTSRDIISLSSQTLLKLAIESARKFGNYDVIERGSKKKWKELWSSIDICIEGDRLIQKLLRLHLYHLMVTASPSNTESDLGIPARGLHGEAYRGHIFWDSVFILPFYTLHFPQITRMALLYRYNRLDRARSYARAFGYDGAMFPWQSGSTGDEETPSMHLNPINQEWGADYSRLQRHVSLAVAHNIWFYFWLTDDADFLKNFGAEMLLEICKFWSSKATLNDSGRYSIRKVMGPDEFHEKFPQSGEEGLKDNSYTNIMVIWAFQKAFEILERINGIFKENLLGKLRISQKDLQRWKDITKRLNLIISKEGILAQFDGYFSLQEMDWEYYRKNYRNIQRLDRILRAENRSPNDYKVSKQADVLMTFYTLLPSEVAEIVKDLGFSIPENYLERNFDYYSVRTSHGSSLSRIVHSLMFKLVGNIAESYRMYEDALKSDYTDIQQGTTGEGIHTGVMGGTVLGAITFYAGVNLRSQILEINPSLPINWRRIKFRITLRGITYYLDISMHEIGLKITSSGGRKVQVMIKGSKYFIDPAKEWIRIPI
ncbi:MAG: beta-phosphoglucomutase family hydrolase [Candidatus Thorarchaeota archaeon]